MEVLWDKGSGGDPRTSKQPNFASLYLEKLYQLKEIYNAAVTVLRESQVLPNLESWLATPRANDFAAMRRDSNIVIVSGPSRTAGIAMELAMGIHGLRELHIVLLP
jgi:hypothetical protein